MGKKPKTGLWSVYVHTNKTNGKRYVGITSQKVEYRWNYGKAYPRNKYFTSAIHRYGWDGFEHTVLFENLSKNDAEEKEKELIARWQTQDRKYGYNITAGGEGTSGFIPSPELRQLWSQIRTGSHRSEETKLKMSQSTALRRPEVMQKSAEAKFKPVSAFSLDGVFYKTFESITSAMGELSLSNAQRSHISDCCNGKRKSCGGYRWQYA